MTNQLSGVVGSSPRVFGSEPSTSTRASERPGTVEDHSRSSLPATRQLSDAAYEAEPQDRRIDQTVFELNRLVQEAGTRVQFHLDRDSREIVVQVTNADDGEVLRQIPSEDALALAKFFKEMLAHDDDAKAMRGLGGQGGGPDPASSEGLFVRVKV